MTKSKEMGKIKKTIRGFEIVKFKDYYGEDCSLQASSLAIYTKPGISAVWLGVDDAKPKCLHGDARKLGVKTNATCGWVDYPIPEEVMLTTRMHLDREGVKQLIAFLKNWLNKGTFKNTRKKARKG